MKVVHLSDTQGLFSALPSHAELVIHSGDMLPNYGCATRQEEEDRQIGWLEQNVKRISRRIGVRSILYCAGDHDFIDPCKYLRVFGVRAFNITNTIVDMRGFLISGLPLVPYDDGVWENERKPAELKAETDAWHDKLAAHKRKAGQRTIVIAHCPPKGFCDLVRKTHTGNAALADVLHAPRFSGLAGIFCGHVHEDHGLQFVNGVVVSNAATTVHVVEIGAAGAPIE